MNYRATQIFRTFLKRKVLIFSKRFQAAYNQRVTISLPPPAQGDYC
jgi:hypothetical protein